MKRVFTTKLSELSKKEIMLKIFYVGNVLKTSNKVIDSHPELMQALLMEYTGCLNIHGAHVTANYSTNKNVVFVFVLDLKIVFYNNY